MRRTAHQPLPLNDSLPLPSSDTADAAFRYERLHWAVDQLPLKERTAVLLFYIEEQSIKEIAIATGSNVFAVKQQLKRGRDHLRKLLNDER